MKFFDVGNKSGIGQFIIARDEEHAAQIARATGHVRTQPKSITELDPIDNLSKLMGEGRCGALAKKLRAMSGEEFKSVLLGEMEEPPQPNEPWFFLYEEKEE